VSSRTSYLICSIERTGSYVLCDGLTLTELAGRPREYFHPNHLTRLFDGPTIEEFGRYIAQIVDEGTTPNGLFGAKIHWGHLQNLLCRLRKFVEFRASTPPEVVEMFFPGVRYIRLSRRDRVRQAISFLKARQTDVWWQMRMWVRANKKQPEKELTFDFAAIEQLIRQIELHEKAWTQFFEEAGVAPLELYYEDLVGSYEETIRRVFDYLGVALPANLMIRKPRYDKQADTLSEEWLRRYYEMKGAEEPTSERKAPLIVASDLFAGTANGAALKIAVAPQRAHKPRRLKIVSYATSSLGGLPAILARCINARTVHKACCISGATSASDVSGAEVISWVTNPAMAASELAAADVVIVHDGHAARQHESILADKAVLTVAHTRAAVQSAFVRLGFPGVVLRPHLAALTEFRDWPVIPLPMPWWEKNFQPGPKPNRLTICFAPVPPTSSPQNPIREAAEELQRTVSEVSERFGGKVNVETGDWATSRGRLEHLRTAHLLIEGCAVSNYDYASIAGLAFGSVVLNGLGESELLTRLVSGSGAGEVESPFVHANLQTFKLELEKLVGFGSEKLVEQGQKNREWLERYWDFTSQWENFWMPVVLESLPPPAPLGKVVHRKASAPKRPVQSVAEVSQKKNGKLTGPPGKVPRLTPSENRNGISVIIVSHNESGYLDRTVLSMLCTLPSDSEVIVVDDHSTDNSVDALPKDDKRLRIVRPPERLGVSRSRNYGASLARGEILVFSDAHVETPPGWMEPLAAMLGNGVVGAVAPTIAALDSANTAKGWGGRVCSSSKLDWKWLERGGTEPHTVPLLCGCFLAVRRDIFNAVGHFDPGMVLYGLEDIEFSFRLWLLGYECIVVPAVEIRHMFRSRKKPLPQYQSVWEPRIHNALRMGVVHYGQDRLKGLIGNNIKNPAFAAAWARLATGDAWERRIEMRKKRVHDDAWFFDTFKLDIDTAKRQSA